ncbi:MAG: nitrogenase iron-molybdenum cofactor biosynthesis protein NifE [Nitrospirae bacterium]|nr:nitrogenase iron-molybdenum cofactor biosynthesis protein NifE [Nitrospirota bacterium]
MYHSTDKLLEKGCQVEQKEKLCRSRGGESCAFDGAMIVLQPIADTAHLVHGPITCCGNSWQGRGTLSRKGTLHRMGFTTDMSELDIIYGSEDKLYRAILKTCETVNPRAIFVYATCVSGLIGEDIEAVCKKAEKNLGIRVIPVNAPGFIGPKNLGNRIAGEVLIDHVIGTTEPATTTPYDINLIGEYNIAGDLWLVEPLLREAGVRVLSRITGDATFHEITYAHRARLNLLVCSRALINVARQMEQKYGIPYVEVSFYGKTETTRALRLIGSCFTDLKDRIEALIARHEANLRLQLKPYSHLRGKRAVLYTGGVKSWSFISALLDLGIQVVAVGTKKSTFEDEEKMREILGEDALLVEDVSASNLKKLMIEHKADILIAGGRNLYLAMKEGFPFVDVNQERHSAYAGYEGLVNFARDISNSLSFFCPPVSTPTVVVSKRNEPKDLLVDPLKHPQSIGAAIALQGIDRTLPVIHSAQGCSFLEKVLITKHFREPIALQSTKLFTEDVVMGAEQRLLEVLKDAVLKHSPDLLGVIGSGLTEVRGEDLQMSLKEFLKEQPDCRVFPISIKEYEGALQEGYAKAVESVLRVIDENRARPGTKTKGQINVLVGPHLTPGDCTELREIIESFGLKPILVPDMAALDGSRTGFSALTSGGTTIQDLDRIPQSEFTLVIGPAMEGPARALQEKYSIEYLVMDSISGIYGTDGLMKTLSILSNTPVPERFLRQRRILVDAMRDAHFFISGRRFCIATERDLALMLSRVITESGGQVKLVVVPVLPERPETIQADQIIEGDLDDIQGEFDLIVSSSHASDRAGQLGVPLYEMGFPVFNRIGYPNRITIGYRGTIDIIQDIANLLYKED